MTNKDKMKRKKTNRNFKKQKKTKDISINKIDENTFLSNNGMHIVFSAKKEKRNFATKGHLKLNSNGFSIE